MVVWKKIIEIFPSCMSSFSSGITALKNWQYLSRTHSDLIDSVLFIVRDRGIKIIALFKNLECHFHILLTCEDTRIAENYKT